MEKQLFFLQRVRRNSQLSAYAHFGASERMSRIHLWLGIPIIIFSLMLGSTLFIDIKGIIPDLIKWIGAGVALCVSSLSGLQTFFNPKENKRLHRRIANRYLEINRKAELLIAQIGDDESTANEFSERIVTLNDEYNIVNNDAEEYPTINRDYNRAKRKIRGIEEQDSKNKGNLFLLISRICQRGYETYAGPARG